MFRSNLVAMRLLPVVAVLFVGCSSGKDNPEVTLEKANIQFTRGNYDDAIPIYTKAAEKLPDRPELYFSRGLCYERLQLDQKAFEDYARCLEIDPQHIDARNNSGVVLANMDRYTEAAEQFTILIEQMPDNVLALRNRGLCYHDLKKFDKALADYDRGIEIAPDDAETWFQRGNVLLEQLKLAEAESDFTKAIELHPEHSKAWMNRGVTRYQLGHMEVAMEDLLHARELDENIVIPGINWVQTAPAAAEVVVAKPLLSPEAMSDRWDGCVNFVLEHLTEQGYSDIKITDDLPEHKCGLLTATKDGKSCEVVLAFSFAADADLVEIPGLATVPQPDSLPRVLVVVADSKTDDPETTGFQVVTFTEDWKPAADRTVPVLSRLKLTPEK